MISTTYNISAIFLSRTYSTAKFLSTCQFPIMFTLSAVTNPFFTSFVIPPFFCIVKSKRKKSPEKFSAVRKGNWEKVLHQPFSSLPGNSKLSNQLDRPVLSLIFFSIAMLSSNTANAFDYNVTCTRFFKTIPGFLKVWDLLHP